MNLLAFDTSTEHLSVALQRGGGGGSAGGVPAQWCFNGPGGAQASSTLIPAIERLMKLAGLDYPDLAAIAFGAGPGSFTGLRTACSVAQGLAFAADVPVLPVDSLMAVAEDARFQRPGPMPAGAQAPADALRVVALLDARMDELYLARYAYRGGIWTIDGTHSLIRPESVAAHVAPAAHPGGEDSSSNLPPDLPPLIFAGNVFGAYGHRINTAKSLCQDALPSARALLRLAPQLLQQGLAVRAEHALPLYIRDKVAKTTEERLREKAAV